MTADSTRADVWLLSMPTADAETNRASPRADIQLVPSTSPLASSPGVAPQQRPTATTRTPPPAKPMPKILFLDGLRGLAAMMVVVNHSGYIKEHNMGAPAVDMFFVLSAFLLTLIFEKKARLLRLQRASTRRWAVALSDYFVRRFLRVYPLFAIVACVLAVLPPAERTRSLRMNHPEKYDLFKVLTFYHDSRPHILWSLPVEIGYYFLIPVFVVTWLTLPRVGRLLMGVAGYALVFYTGLELYKYRKQHSNAWPHVPTLLCGSLAAVVYTTLSELIAARGFVFQHKMRHVYALRTLELVLLVLLCSNLFDGLAYDWLANGKPTTPGATRFISVHVTVLIVCEMLLPGPLSTLLEWSLLRFAGQVSFSMYLLHIFVVYRPFVEKSSYYNKFFLLWTLVFLLSAASFHAVEKPCQRLAARVGAWLKQKDAEVIATEAAMAEKTKTRTMTTTTAKMVKMVKMKMAMTEAELAKAC